MYDNFIITLIIEKKTFSNLKNSLDIINMTKDTNVNNKTSFIYVMPRNHRQVCNAVDLDDLAQGHSRSKTMAPGHAQFPINILKV